MAITGESFKVNEQAIEQVLSTPAIQNPARVRAILSKALGLRGLQCDEVGTLIQIEDPQLLEDLFQAARRVKEEIYGNRIVLFAPVCACHANECRKSALRASNQGLASKPLSMDELKAETRAVIRTGQKRIVLLAGEALGLDDILDGIRTVYATKEGRGEIRCVNVEIAPLSVEDYRRLHAAGIGTSITFQKTYHRSTYEQNHRQGGQQDYAWHLECMDRAMEAGIQDVGIGALLGLADWRFELLAMLQHAKHLEKRFGCGPHSISVPRIEAATGSDGSQAPAHPVSDQDFKKLIAILRLAVPYTGIVLSTRESPETRKACLQLGVSQISTASLTRFDGHGEGTRDGAPCSQGDPRSLDEVVKDICDMGFLPSFCTGCYRLGRVGAEFMDLAKPGDIKTHCHPNAISTFQEYLDDYASPATLEAGQACIERTLGGMEPNLAKFTRGMVDKIKNGNRDVYC